MGTLRAAKAALDPMFGSIVKRLRREAESATHEPLPARWVELIRHLDEQERTPKMGERLTDQDATSKRKERS